MKKITKLVLYFILAVLLVCLILISIEISQIVFGGKKYINIFGYSIFIVNSNSMSPNIKKDDILIVKIGKEASIGDIVTYEEDNSLITHRIIDISGNEIITKGDANNSTDLSIKKEAMIGKVVCVLKNVAVWKEVFKSPEVYIFIITTIILFVSVILYSPIEKLIKNKGK